MDKKMHHRLTCLIEDGGDLNEIRRILEDHREEINQCYGTNSWLRIAAAEGQVEVVKLLLDMGADPNKVCFLEAVRTGLTALCSAVTAKQVGVLKFLLENGAVPNDETRVMLKASHSDSEETALEMVKLLHEHGSNIHRIYINEYNGKKMNALSHAQGYPKLEAYLKGLGCKLPEESEGEPQ